MLTRRTRSWTRILLIGAVLGAGPAAGELPPEGSCQTIGNLLEGASIEDAGAARVAEGTVLTPESLLALRSLFPPELWAQRKIFFFPGMRLEVGPCHRRYPVPGFFSRTTAEYGQRARLDEDGNLVDYVAGVPFPPESIDPGAEDAGTKWAWNLTFRYRGAGYTGSFRLVDLPSRIGVPETYLGSFFLIQTGHRADLVQSGFSVPEANQNLFVAGGRFEEPFNARHLAWRQMRPDKALRSYKESDRTWVYVPDMRKVRRAATAWVDGMYTPRYRVAGTTAGGGSLPYQQGGQVIGIQPTSSWSAAATENLRRGFVGLVLRPNAYVWKLRGTRDVLAPLNSTRLGYPIDSNRNFGPSGLSMADDRWDLRRAVIIEGISRVQDEDVSRITLYVDYQTRQPLYYISRNREGLLSDVGILVHRFSGDDPEYPEWPGGGKALVFDPVAASFFAASDGRSGWRRESYDVRSVPTSESEIERMTSVAELDRGH